MENTDFSECRIVCRRCHRNSKQLLLTEMRKQGIIQLSGHLLNTSTLEEFLAIRCHKGTYIRTFF